MQRVNLFYYRDRCHIACNQWYVYLYHASVRGQQLMVHRDWPADWEKAVPVYQPGYIAQNHLCAYGIQRCENAACIMPGRAYHAYIGIK